MPENKAPQLEWTRFELVPYSEEKHGELFDPDEERPEYVWEGEPPEGGRDLLVACKDGTIVFDGGYDADVFTFYDTNDFDALYWAYTEWKKESK